MVVVVDADGKDENVWAAIVSWKQKSASSKILVFRRDHGTLQSTVSLGYRREFDEDFIPKRRVAAEAY